ncbi:MAG: hypothetical protein RJB38_348 [Pseudomonadota bacterium]|jgi:hypothetical protein
MGSLKKQTRFRFLGTILLASLAPSAPNAFATDPTFEELADQIAKQRRLTHEKERASYTEKTQTLLSSMGRIKQWFEGDAPANPKAPGKDSWTGLIPQASRALQEAEKEPKKAKNPYKKDYPPIKDTYEVARQFSRVVQEHLNDSTLPREERFAVLERFIADVLSPLRALTIIQGKESPDFAGRNFFRELLPKVPANLLAPDDKKTASTMLERLQKVGIRAVSASGDVPACETPLDLDPQFWLIQDAAAAGSAPTKDNYTRALKLTTLSMMLAQLEIHKQLTGNTRPIQIPQACRERLDADLPEKIEVSPLDDATREERYNAIMAANGLSQLSPEFEEAFIAQDLGDPKEKGFIGYSPFERLHAAEAALKIKKDQPFSQPPAIDDRDAYSAVLESRMPQVLSALEKSVPQESTAQLPKPSALPSRPVYVPPPSPTQEDIEKRQKKLQQASQTLQPLLQQADDIRSLGEVPKALIARMDSKQAAHWSEVVPEPVRKKLESTSLTLPFPPAFSPPSYRSWAIREVHQFIKQTLQDLERIERKAPQDRSKEERQLLSQAMQACLKSPIVLRVGPGCLAPAERPGTVPVSRFFSDTLRRLEEAKLETRSSGDFHGPLDREEILLMEANLSDIWNTFSAQIPGATLSEWNLLHSQIGSNPFAGLRLEGLIQEHEAKASKNPSQALLIQSTLKSLGVDQPVLPFVANRVWSQSERSNYWAKIKEEHDSANLNLLSQNKLGTAPEKMDRYYEQAEKLASTRTLNRDEALDAARSAQLGRKTAKTPSYEDELNELLKNEEPRKAELLRKIYEARGNSAEQDRLFEEYAKTFKLDAEDTGREARKALLSTDFMLKRPLYRRLIERASNQKQVELTAALADLCNLKPSDHEKFKLLVLSTAKAQDELNRQLGLKGLPKNVQEELDRMSKKDWKELGLSGLAMGLFIGSSLLLTVATGGLATPAVAAGAAALSGAMAVGSFTVGSVVIPKMWLEELPNAAERTRYAQTFEDLRLTNRESVERLQSEEKSMKRWGIAANIFFGAQMIKPTALALQTSARGTAILVQAAKTQAKSAERVSLQAAAAQASRDVETITAEYLFGYRKLGAEALSPRSFATRVWKETAKPLVLHAKSTDQVLQDSTKLYMQVFRDDPNQLKGFLTSLRGRIASSAERAASGGLEFPGKNWIRRSRLEKREMVGTIDNMLQTLERDGLERTLSSKNAAFSELIEKMPRSKGDWLATVTIEGVPGLATRNLHLKEISAARRTLLRELETAHGGAALASGAPTAISSTQVGSKLLKELRENLHSRGSEGEAEWSRIRSEFQKNLGSNLVGPLDSFLERGLELPASAWRGPELRSTLEKLEQQSRSYSNVVEFDEWLAIKRLKKEAEKASKG